MCLWLVFLPVLGLVPVYQQRLFSSVRACFRLPLPCLLSVLPSSVKKTVCMGSKSAKSMFATLVVFSDTQNGSLRLQSMYHKKIPQHSVGRSKSQTRKATCRHAAGGSPAVNSVRAHVANKNIVLTAVGLTINSSSSRSFHFIAGFSA